MNWDEGLDEKVYKACVSITIVPNFIKTVIVFHLEAKPFDLSPQLRVNFIIL